MIYGNIKYVNSKTELADSIKKCISYVKNNDLLNVEPGSYEIEGKDLFLNIMTYQTKAAENCFWEAHKQYLDVHFILEGTEEVALNFIDNLENKEYIPEKDFLPLEGIKSSNVILTPGDFLVCYPEDAHMTAIQVDKPVNVKKLIFKIKY